MFSNEVNKCLRKLDVMHYGVYPCDLLPFYVQTPAAIVVNSEPHNSPGLHWMAIFIDINRELDFLIVMAGHLEDSLLDLLERIPG